MAYGPFSSDIGLVQAWDSDLDYGTGDFYYMIWVNLSSHAPLQGIWYYWKSNTIPNSSKR